MTGPLDLSLTAAGRALREGTLTTTALLEAGEARRDALGDGLGAYVERHPVLRQRQAAAADAAFAAGADLGPLHGIPVSVKDVFGVTGHTTRAGSPRPLPAPWDGDGTVVAALRRRLAVFTGKTHSVEFAFGGLGTNPHHPVPVNPWDAGGHRVPGGSSAGAGVSLHVDALVALGTDTAGSARIPAAMTGTVGLKTTLGRWPVDGVVPLSPSFDTVGLMTRTVADARLAFAAVEAALGMRPAAAGNPLPDLAGRRLGLCRRLFWEDLSPGIEGVIDRVIGELEAAGARVVAVDLPEVEACLELFRAGHLAAPELHEFLTSELPAWIETLDPRVAQRVGDAGTLTAAEYLGRRRRLARLAAAAAERLAGIDALVTPTVAVTPPRLENVATAADYRRHNLLALRNPAMANLLGLCALTLPVGLDAAAMPVGLQLMSRGGADARLLALGAACEAVLGAAPERLGTPPRCRG